MIGMPPESRALCRQVVDMLPAPTADPLAFEDYELSELVLRGGKVNPEIAATYTDYYGQRTIRFNETDVATDDFPDYITTVPRSEWNEWNVVLSGAEVYVESTETTRLERGAVVQPAEDCITKHLEALAVKDVAPKLAAEHLRMLGRLPFMQVGLRNMRAKATRGLHLDQSRVDFDHNERALIVHTPRGSMWTGVHDSRQMTLQAQASGALESVRFYADGDCRPAGATHDLRYGREGIAFAQANYLRRKFASI